MSDDPTNEQIPSDSSSDEVKSFAMSDATESEQSISATEEVPQEPEVEPLSVSDKLIGIYTEPSATFENLKKAKPLTSDWLVPMLVMIVISLIVTMVKFNDPNFIREISHQQEERMQQMVDEGKMSQEKVDESLDQMQEMGSTMMMVSSVIGVIVGTPIVFLILALIYWIFLRYVFKGSATYRLVFSALALTVYISILDTIFSLILGYATGNPFASLSPAMFMEFQPKDTMYILMASLKPIGIWSMVVLSIGFTKVAEISKGKAYGLVFGLWILWTVVGSALGMSGFGM